MGRIFYQFDLLARTSGSLQRLMVRRLRLAALSRSSRMRFAISAISLSFAGSSNSKGSFLVKTRADFSVIASPKPGGPTRSESSQRMAFQENRVRHWLAHDFECFVRETP